LKIILFFKLYFIFKHPAELEIKKLKNKKNPMLISTTQKLIVLNKSKNKNNLKWRRKL